MTLFHLWDLPGDVLAAPESASGLDRCNLSLSLSLPGSGSFSGALLGAVQNLIWALILDGRGCWRCADIASSNWSERAGGGPGGGDAVAGGVLF